MKIASEKKKRDLGQFFTTNADYIFQGFEKFIDGKEVIDPFAGNQELLNWCQKNGAQTVVGFDCDKNYVDDENVFFNDSINSPQKYNFICTNPPYLHKNKAPAEIKKCFFRSGNAIFEDLYQISIKSILNCHEGIIIVPLNFLCAQNSLKIRNLFFEKFEIIKLNIFTEQVFDDTTYNVISFYFKRKIGHSEKNVIKATIFPAVRNINFEIERRFGWQFGGDFISKIKKTKNDLGIFRFTDGFIKQGDCEVEIALQNINHRRVYKTSYEVKKKLEDSILFLRAIDSKNGKKIQLEDIRNYKVAGLAGKSTSRNMAHLLFRKEISIDEQMELMKIFNDCLAQNREKYGSFFLTNFRDNNRKRISFDLAYKFLNLIYNEKYQKQPSLF